MRQNPAGVVIQLCKETAMFGLGWAELLIILVIIIALFGAKRLSGIGSALGGSIREFKQAVRDDDAPAIKPEAQGDSKA